MKLIFVRHGVAAPKKPQQSDQQDFQRKLTRPGRKEVKKTVRAAVHLFSNVETLFSSPLLRAIETAEVLYDRTHPRNFEFLSSLDKHSTPQDFYRDLKTLDPKKIYCFVGHEPHLSSSLQLILKVPSLRLEIAKSGIVVLEGEDLASMRLTVLLSPLGSTIGNGKNNPHHRRKHE